MHPQINTWGHVTRTSTCHTMATEAEMYIGEQTGTLQKHQLTRRLISRVKLNTPKKKKKKLTAQISFKVISQKETITTPQPSLSELKGVQLHNKS